MTHGRVARSLVSIVTPSFNHARFIEATIRSVLEQDYPRLEYFVMDGGSTDESVRIIERYAKRLAGWISEPDGGQSAAINNGWRRAHGEILAYLNSDDLYRPDAIRRAVEYLEAHPDVGMVYSDCEMIDADGQRSEPTAVIPEFSLTWLLRNPLPQPTMFLRRTVVERIGFFDEGLRYVMDWDFCLRAAMAGIVIARIPGAPLAAFRNWGGQKTANRFEQHIEEQLRIRDRLLADSHLPPRLAREIALSKAWAFLWPAYQLYLRGDMTAARRVLDQAVVVHRTIAAHPEFLGLYLRTLLGRRVAHGARGIKMKLRAGLSKS